jgi:hypothetical protein
MLTASRETELVLSLVEHLDVQQQHRRHGHRAERSTQEME